MIRSDRRFVVKRYIERVLSNSSQWQQLAKSSFSIIEPIPQAYTMTDNEVKLMHHLFSWHLNKTLTFPIIGGCKKENNNEKKNVVNKLYFKFSGSIT